MVDPLAPHSHSNNTTPPDNDPSITLLLPDGDSKRLTLEALRQDYPVTQVAYSYVTSHGNHGPYTLTGVALRDLLADIGTWTQVEVLSADGFGNRIWRQETLNKERPIMLYYLSDGELLTRQNGLVRLVVPTETDNALRQVKWVRELKVKG